MPSQKPPVTLVTGASRGLGRGIAIELASAGHHVAVHYSSNHAEAETTAALCQQAATSTDQRFFPVGGDISQSTDRDRIFEITLTEFGHLDSLVNNAGITSPGRLDILEATEENWDTVLGVNLKGPFFLAQKAANYWLGHPGDSRLSTGYKLVFVSSISAFAASTNRGDYCISKAATKMTNHLWAARLAEHGIQTVELVPGIMLTDMTAGVKEKYDALIADGLVPQRRWGTPEDTGKAVRAFLDGSLPFTTGDQIHIDGGFHLRTL
ncbi:MAG: 3-ketoacyl-ACP reductase [Verrucomicrobiales bacterium]|nr:3-ketoacyl-ACP reductase [Verrucomicrobiales bacterium]